MYSPGLVKACLLPGTLEHQVEGRMIYSRTYVLTRLGEVLPTTLEHKLELRIIYSRTKVLTRLAEVLPTVVLSGDQLQVERRIPVRRSTWYSTHQA
jgi:hypothetical protein